MNEHASAPGPAARAALDDDRPGPARAATGTALLLAMVSVGLACAREDNAPGMAVQSGESPAQMDHSHHMGGAASTRDPVMLTANQERALGVTYYRVETKRLERTIRTLGRVETVESAETTVTPKIDGFVEELLVATTGEVVRRGQPLLTLYSPDLVAAQEQLLTARRLAEAVDPDVPEAHESALSLLAAARRRLDFWDITADQVEHLLATGEVKRTLSLVSPANGVVLEKAVTAGQKVTAGLPLYRIVDLSTVWIEGDVFEQDLDLVKEGAQARIEVSAYPGEYLTGRVTFVYPVVDVQTRTNQVRVTLANPGLRLKPGMFATVFFEVQLAEDLLAAPVDAVIVTGERNLVFVRGPDGMLRPQEVVLGRQSGGYVQILAGIEAGAEIVASANFMVDAESRLGSGAGGMHEMHDGAAAAPDTPAVDHSEHMHHPNDPADDSDPGRGAGSR